MELAKFEFRQPPLLTDEEVEEILGRIDELIAWASDIKDYALQSAISGKQWSGYKLSRAAPTASTQTRMPSSQP